MKAAAKAGQSKEGKPSLISRVGAWLLQRWATILGGYVVGTVTGAALFFTTGSHQIDTDVKATSARLEGIFFFGSRNAEDLVFGAPLLAAVEKATIGDAVFVRPTLLIATIPDAQPACTTIGVVPVSGGLRLTPDSSDGRDCVLTVKISDQTRQRIPVPWRREQTMVLSLAAGLPKDSSLPVFERVPVQRVHLVAGEDLQVFSKKDTCNRTKGESVDISGWGIELRELTWSPRETEPQLLSLRVQAGLVGSFKVGKAECTLSLAHRD